MPDRMNDVIVLLGLKESIADLADGKKEKQNLFISSKVLLPKSFNMCSQLQ